MNDLVQRARQIIPFDALVVGSGTRDYEQGHVTISPYHHLENLPSSFVEEYGRVSEDDIVGRLFAAFPHLVQITSVADYEELKLMDDAAGIQAGKKIADYLRKYRIEHLLLAGIESSYGLTWATFYRFDPQKRFTEDEAERAKYLLPVLLYDWQTECIPKANKAPRPPVWLLPLTPAEMQVTVLFLEGLSYEGIAARSSKTLETVKKLMQNVRVRLGLNDSGGKLTLASLHGRRPPTATKQRSPKK
jgi:DNA-binding CsgD family transcriptional regulator